MTIKAKPYILDIEPYKPGRSRIGENQKIIKLSSNENALGCSPSVLKIFQESSNQIFRYPDGNSLKLREAIAEKHDIEVERLVCGAGSDEIIALITHSFCDINDEILYSEYGFLMYSISAKRVGAIPIFAKELNFKSSMENILAKITSKTKIIFLANPNNPTGSYLNKNEINQLIAKVPKNIIIVLDLAYAEYVNQEDYPDTIELVNKNENVVMIRTFSKIYGLASLRLGWSYSSKYIAEVLNKARGPFNVSGIAQSCGIAAIKDGEFINQSRLHNDKWLKILTIELSKIGLKICPSVANFVLINFPSEEMCKKFNDFLLSNGIILREMSAYKLPNCLRLTIGLESENQKVIELMLECGLLLSKNLDTSHKCTRNEL